MRFRATVLLVASLAGGASRLQALPPAGDWRLRELEARIRRLESDAERLSAFPAELAGTLVLMSTGATPPNPAAGEVLAGLAERERDAASDLRDAEDELVRVADALRGAVGLGSEEQVRGAITVAWSRIALAETRLDDIRADIRYVRGAGTDHPREDGRSIIKRKIALLQQTLKHLRAQKALLLGQDP